MKRDAFLVFLRDVVACIPIVVDGIAGLGK